MNYPNDAIRSRLLLPHEVEDITILYDPEHRAIGIFQGEHESGSEQVVTFEVELLRRVAEMLQKIDFDLCCIGEV